MMPRVYLAPRRAKPFFGQHPWVYPGAIDRIDGDPADGAVVDLYSSAGNFIARGLFNSKSKLRVRLYTWRDVPLDRAFFRERVAAAWHLRNKVLKRTGPGQACRVIFSEADGISGLVVDRYDRWLILQFTSLGLAQRREELADILQEVIEPEGMYLRTERGIGQLEGLELHDGLLRGSVPSEPAAIYEGDLRFQVHLTEGQKTGFYLDQRDNRRAVARLAEGRRMLDGFCYTGGFGLHAARAGAREVVGVDVSEPALTLARENARLNGLEERMRFERADVFDFLAELSGRGEKFGLVVLDPPKFARSGNAVDEALRGYRRLMALGINLLETDGILVMCCCTGLIQREDLHGLLAQLGADFGRPIQILESRGPSPDHPVLATCPETNYLKCLVCRVG